MNGAGVMMESNLHVSLLQRGGIGETFIVPRIVASHYNGLRGGPGIERYRFGISVRLTTPYIPGFLIDIPVSGSIWENITRCPPAVFIGFSTIYRQ